MRRKYDFDFDFTRMYLLHRSVGGQRRTYFGAISVQFNRYSLWEIGPVFVNLFFYGRFILSATTSTRVYIGNHH